VAVPSGWSQQYYLYTPSVVGGEGKVASRDGVLVQEVSVQKGDTLYGISRRFSRHGSYYPQILLFNDIKDPNRIYPGDVFKIPVSRNVVSGHVDKAPVKNEITAELGGEVATPRSADASTSSAATGTDKSAHDLKKVAGREKKRAPAEKAAGAAHKQVTKEKQHAVTAAAANSAAGQKLFERAVKAYRQAEYRSALELFDRYLAENQASPLAADASLYKAECYLKLSAQN
jgi:LysM repeat protein